MKKKYTIPKSEFIEYSPGIVMGAQFSILSSEEKEDESWDSKEQKGSWSEIWSYMEP